MVKGKTPTKFIPDPGRMLCFSLDGTGEASEENTRIYRDKEAYPLQQSTDGQACHGAQGHRVGPAKGEQRQPPELKRLDRQQRQTADDPGADLPKICDRVGKENAKGYNETWNGFKLHVDVNDAGLRYY